MGSIGFPDNAKKNNCKTKEKIPSGNTSRGGLFFQPQNRVPKANTTAKSDNGTEQNATGSNIILACRERVPNL